MDDLLDMIAADESPSQISDKIKELLFTKSAEKIDDSLVQLRSCFGLKTAISTKKLKIQK